MCCDKKGRPISKLSSGKVVEEPSQLSGEDWEKDGGDTGLAVDGKMGA